MGRQTTSRIRVESEAKRVAAKSFYQCVRAHLRQGYAASPRLADELTNEAVAYLAGLPEHRSPEQIRVPLPTGRDNHRRKTGAQQTTPALLTPCTFEPDLALLKTQGVRAMQNARLMRLVREAWLQHTTMIQDVLAGLCNMTRQTVGSRLRHLRALGIRLPTVGDTHEVREHPGEDYSTQVLRALVQGRASLSVQTQYYATPAMLDEFLHRLRLVRHYAHQQHGARAIRDWVRVSLDVVVEYLDLIQTHEGQRHFELLIPQHLPTEPEDPSLPDTVRFVEGLQRDYGLARAEATLLHQDLLVDFGPAAAEQRKPGQILFYATKSTEPAGKPLAECELVPVVLDYRSDDDRQAENVDALKLGKARRYAEQAKAQGAYLTHADLGYLLGVSSGVIDRLQARQVHENVKPLPTRGREADMGRAITHRTHIVDLWMQIYTETEIVRRTGHSYSSVENYITAFGRFALLKDRQMPLPMIRKVLSCSMALVEAYEELYQKYNTEDYWYRFELLRARVLREEAPDSSPEPEAVEKKLLRPPFERRSPGGAESRDVSASALQEPQKQAQEPLDPALRVRQEVSAGR